MDTQKSSNKLHSLFGSERFSDITFVVGKEPAEKRIHGHRLILSLHSEVFEAMFYGKLTTCDKEITFPEDDPDSFELLIKYIYTDELDLTSVEQALNVLCLADKYLVLGVKKHCVSYLSKNISSDLVISIYEVAQLVNEQGLRLLCWKHIIFHTSEVLRGSIFLDAAVSTVTSILAQDFLNVESEMLLYDAIVRWGQHQCVKHGLPDLNVNIRKQIESLLPYIKFSVMTPESFIRSLELDEILSAEEQLIILKNIIVPGIRRLPTIFNDDRVKRNPLLPGKSLIITSEGFRKCSPAMYHLAVGKYALPYFKEVISFPFYDVFIYGFRVFLSLRCDECILPRAKCSMSFINITRNHKVERENLDLRNDESDFVIETDDPIYLPCGEVCQVELRIQGVQVEKLYYCSGNCKLPSIVNMEGKGIGLHVHGILLWHIFQGPTGA